MRTLVLISLALLTVSCSIHQQAKSGDSNQREGYDARLRNYEYPYSVEFLPVSMQGQTYEMAYMDVQPEAPNGHTVLLLHGKNFSGAYWKRTIHTLTSEGYRVIAPDQIGFGKSSKPVNIQYSFHALATNTKHLLKHLGVEKTHVLGHSMGGMLATRFALMFPDTTDRLVLVNPIGLEDWKRKVPYTTIQERFRQELKKTPEKIKSYMKTSYFAGTWKPKYDPLVDIQAGWTKGPDFRLLAQVSALTYDMIFTQPVVHEFPDLEVPVLLIIGQRDRTALGTDKVSREVAQTLGNYPELGRRTADAIPNSTLVELDDVGHVPHYEAPDRFRSALIDFLPSWEK